MSNEKPLIKLHTIDDPDPAPVELSESELAEQTNDAPTAAVSNSAE